MKIAYENFSFHSNHLQRTLEQEKDLEFSITYKRESIERKLALIRTYILTNIITFMHLWICQYSWIMIRMCPFSQFDDAHSTLGIICLSSMWFFPSLAISLLMRTFLCMPWKQRALTYLIFDKCFLSESFLVKKQSESDCLFTPCNSFQLQSQKLLR